MAILALCAGLAAAAHAAPGDPAIEEARQFVAAGRLRDAEAAYDRLLEAAPGSLEARIGRGYARAFQHDFPGAKADFREALANDPGNIGALCGLGYALAWSGAHAEAEEQFRRALVLAPGQPDAVKGLAYVALWGGNAPEATRRFEELAREQPENAEAHVGLGQSLLVAGRRSEARVAFSRALELEPARPDARAGFESLREGLRVDATIFGGLSDTDGTRKAGLRFAEIGVSPIERARFWFQVDDSLSLDALGLARRDQHVTSYFVGALATWSDQLATRLEAGWRPLTSGGVQALVRGEQIFVTSGAVVFKVGGFVGPRPDGLVEASGHAAVQVPLGSGFTVEPAIFYGRSGVAGEHEVRGVLSAGLRLANGLELGGGIAAGRAFSPTPQFEGALGSAYAMASAPLGPRLRAHLLVKHDRPQAGPPTTAYALGMAFNFGGRP